MFDVSNQLAVQSYCFRAFKTIDGLIEQIKSIGLTHVELCEVHFDFNNEAIFESTAEQFKKSGIQIDSVGVQGFKGDDLINQEKWFRFCKLVGAKMISAAFNINGTPGSFKSTEAFAEKYDVVIGIHNHGGYDWLGNATMIDQVLRNTGPRMGLCTDSAWCMHAGEDPLKWVERFNDRLFGVHVKDFAFNRAGKGEDVVSGTGNLKLPEFMKLVLKAPQLQTVTVEYEGDRENPAPKLRECIAKIKEATAS